MQRAPFHADCADAPAGGGCVWLHAGDGTRLRAGIWPEGTRGTVLVFPGRTEYVEKYGPLVGVLARDGYAALVMDWRGQGLADRLLDDPQSGHVTRFSDYQLDVAAALDTARSQGLPTPYYLIAHSMGGCIGLRALMNGLPVAAAVFSAPMWGISIASYIRPFARFIGATARRFGQGHRYAPGTSAKNYITESPFEGNTLTSDPAMYAVMQNQLRAHPDLSLGGPSFTWLHEALEETRALAALASPATPCLTGLGTAERIVDPKPVHDRMARWPNGRLALYEGSEHEILMERPAIRDKFLADILAHLAAHRRMPAV